MFFGKKCSVEGCNKKAYAEGMCREHYIQKLNEEQGEDPKKGIGTLRYIASVGMFAVWVALTICFMMFCVHLYRIASYPQILLPIGMLLFMWLSYMPVLAVLRLIDRSKPVCIAVVTVVVFLACLVILRTDEVVLYAQSITKSLAEWITMLFRKIT